MKKDGCDIELPLVKCTQSDVYGSLFVNSPNDETYRDGLLKLQTWILNFAEEQVRPLRDSGMFTEEQLDEVKRRYSVISPITLTLYYHWLQAEQFAKMTDSEREKWMLDKLPDRFKARFRGNAACRNAREVSSDESSGRDTDSESDGMAPLGIEQVVRDLQSDNPPEYIKKFLDGV